MGTGVSTATAFFADGMLTALTLRENQVPASGPLGVLVELTFTAPVSAVVNRLQLKLQLDWESLRIIKVLDIPTLGTRPRIVNATDRIELLHGRLPLFLSDCEFEDSLAYRMLARLWLNDGVVFIEPLIVSSLQISAEILTPSKLANVRWIQEFLDGYLPRLHLDDTQIEQFIYDASEFLRAECDLLSDSDVAIAAFDRCVQEFGTVLIGVEEGVQSLSALGIEPRILQDSCRWVFPKTFVLQGKDE